MSLVGCSQYSTANTRDGHLYSEAVRSSFPGPRGRPTTCTRPPNAAVPPPRRPLIGRPPPTTHEAAHGRQGNSFGGIGLTTMRTRVLLADTTTTEVAYLLWLPKGGPVGRGEGGHPLAIQNGAVDRPGGHPSHRQPHVGPRGDHGREPKIRPSPGVALSPDGGVGEGVEAAATMILSRRRGERAAVM